MSNNLFKGVVKLTQTQFDTLKETGTLTVSDETITYSPSDTIYVVEDNMQEQLNEKLDKNQGTENASKLLEIDDNGNIVPSSTLTSENILISTDTYILDGGSSEV